MFSLSKFRKVSEDGVTFQSHLDGSTYTLTPESAMDLQVALGSDIMMALDDCLAYPASPEAAAQSMRRSMEWAGRCSDRFREAGSRSARTCSELFRAAFIRICGRRAPNV